jgi:ATP-dependent DNA helicase RecG
MTEFELNKYLLKHFPKEDEYCEWKEFKNLKHSISGNEADDVISYISAISNMQGGDLILGVQDQTLEVVGIQNFHNYTTENLKYKLLQDCTNLSSEGLNITSLETSDSGKIVWIIHIPKHASSLLSAIQSIPLI